MGDLKSFCAERKAENNIFGRRCNIAESSDPGIVICAAVRVDIPVPVDFERSHEAPVEAAAVIKVELHGHIADRTCANHGAELASSCRQSAHTSGFHRKRETL